MNLITNAMYTEGDNGRSRRITVRAETTDNTLVFSVADDGEGIMAEHLTQVFVHGYTTREGGHGFGLHSSASAAKEMGGALTADSDGPGRGAQFVLEVPLQLQEMAA